MKTGTQVQLKSGGARMTVRDLPLPGVSGEFEKPIKCEWHSTTGQPFSVTYDQDQLKIVIEDSTPGRVATRATKSKRGK